MAGSNIGTIFQITTWGESHGKALGVVIDGCPAGIPLSEDDIQKYMDRRKPGQSAITTQRKESDTIKILSGVFEGKTTGTPISLMVENTSQRSSDYSEIAEYYRPGHADYTFDQKYGFRDYRGGGRSSGRETIGRVAAGAIAAKLLQMMGIEVCAYTKSIGPVTISKDHFDKEAILSTPTGMPDRDASSKAEAYLEECIKNLDSAGGVIECIVKGMPAGIGDPVFEKLDANLAKAMMSVGAVKAVEIGDGIAVATANGSTNNDSFRSVPSDATVKTFPYSTVNTPSDAAGNTTPYITVKTSPDAAVQTPSGITQTDSQRIVKSTNHSGGILGGISDGSDIVLRAYIKPTPSIFKPQETVNKAGENITVQIKGRHDPVIVPRAVVVIECMTAITVLDALLKNMSARAENIVNFYKTTSDNAGLSVT